MLAFEATTADPTQKPRDADAALMAAIAHGDRRSFAELYERHRRPLYRLAYGVLLDVDEARDAVQEAFLRLHRAAPDWEPRAQVGTWLYRVVLNHCLGLRQRLRRIFSPPAERAPATPEDRAVLGQAIGVVERSLADLPPKQRAVACLCLEAELPPAEIAPLVDLTPNATRVNLHRALARLRADLAAAGFDTPPDPMLETN